MECSCQIFKYMGPSVDESLGTKVRKLTLKGNHNPVHKPVVFWGTTSQ